MCVAGNFDVEEEETIVRFTTMPALVVVEAHVLPKCCLEACSHESRGGPKVEILGTICHDHMDTIPIPKGGGKPQCLVSSLLANLDSFLHTLLNCDALRGWCCHRYVGLVRCLTWGPGQRLLEDQNPKP